MSEIILEIIDEGQVQIIELIEPGPQGPAGPAGATGATGAAGASHLANLLDVNVTAKVNNSVLYYNQASEKFIADDINTVVTITDGGNF